MCIKLPDVKMQISTTDPESGMFHKGEQKKCFAYSAQTICDRHNFVLEVNVNSGIMHSNGYLQMLKRNTKCATRPTEDCVQFLVGFFDSLRRDENHPALPFSLSCGLVFSEITRSVRRATSRAVSSVRRA